MGFSSSRTLLANQVGDHNIKMKLYVVLALVAMTVYQSDALCVDTKPKDTCDAWKHFGFCYKGNKTMEWCCATCSEKLDEPEHVEVRATHGNSSDSVTRGTRLWNGAVLL